MKIRKLFWEVEASNEPVRAYRYEPGMQHDDANKGLLQLLAKIYKSNQQFLMIVVTLQIKMV